MEGLLSTEDFSDVSMFTGLGNLDMLATVCAKVAEIEEKLKAKEKAKIVEVDDVILPTIVMPMEEKQALPFDLNLPPPMATTTHCRRTTITRPRTSFFNATHDYEVSHSNTKRIKLSTSGLPSWLATNHNQNEVCSSSTNKEPTKGTNKFKLRIIPPAPPRPANRPPEQKHLQPLPPPVQPVQPPELPEKFRQKIQELNGYDTKFVFLKRIYQTDLEKSQSRLAMPEKQCKSCQDELEAIKNDTPVLVIQPNDGELDAKVLNFTKWATNKSYILNCGWPDFLETIQTENPLKPGNYLHVWYFKLPASPSHGFALVRI